MTDIDRAAEILRAGGLVAFPTETVYGLGADATRSDAVMRIFSAKGRAADNPLIAHVADEAMARRHAAQWPDSAQQLARKFWPGPLTLVVPASSAIAREVTAGGPTVGLRSPDHPIAQALLRAFDGPIAAPSANRSERISPTTAEHVRAELGGSVDLVLDGGPCRVGIESTVLDLSGKTATILRPGAITLEQISAEIGEVRLGGKQAGKVAASPGQGPVHYAPRLPAFRTSRAEFASAVQQLLQRGQKLAALSIGPLADVPRRQIHFFAELPELAESYAHELYAALRRADQSGADVILVEMPPEEPQWLAIRDRLMRASKPSSANRMSPLPGPPPEYRERG
ncbi:MAG TPA: L-threonylcarbamoyladenylate synthase [Tepidisphaeraceae bacterium]|nr:L-threonylcarbamoyladenylate synthase [Tepidisphaeraceae bacterium]